MERVGAFTATCMLLIVAGMLWWALLYSLWRMAAASVQWNGYGIRRRLNLAQVPQTGQDRRYLS